MSFHPRRMFWIVVAPGVASVPSGKTAHGSSLDGHALRLKAAPARQVAENAQLERAPSQSEDPSKVRPRAQPCAHDVWQRLRVRDGPRWRHVVAEAGRERAVQLHRAEPRLRLVGSAKPQALGHGFDHHPDAEAGVHASDVDSDSSLVQRIDGLLRVEALGLLARDRQSHQVAGQAERDGPEANRGAHREVERRHRALDDVPALNAVGRQRKVRVVREARVRIPVDPPAERDIERAPQREPADPRRRRERRRAQTGWRSAPFRCPRPRRPAVRAARTWRACASSSRAAARGRRSRRDSCPRRTRCRPG